MQPQFQDNEEDFGGIDLEANNDEINNSEQDEIAKSAIDLDEYDKSNEKQEVSWWDWTKDVGVQSIRGVAQAFTWPLDVLKIGMIGEGLSDIDELEESFKKAGKPFNRDDYIKTVMEQGEYIPTQSFFEQAIEDATGFNLKPKTESGKFINKAATIGSLTKGSPLTKILSGAVAGSTKQGLKALGVDETFADLGSDVAGGITQAVKKSARIFTPEAEKLKNVADKFGLPFYEFMTKPPGGVITPKISKAREAIIMKELGITSDQASKQIIEGKLPISQLRKRGINLSQLEKDSYDQARKLAQSKPQNIDPKDIISDIDNEITRLKSIAPSPGQGTQESINILEREKSIFEKSLPNQKAPPVKRGQKAQPAPKAVPITSEQLINQHIEYNSNVKGLYKKPEMAGKEEAVRDTYAFLNNSIRNTMEKQSGSDVSDAFKTANKIFSQNAMLKESEMLINKAFVDGNYNPKKLTQVLNSKQGLKLKRNLGDKAVKELTEIAQFGEKAVNHTSQILKNPKYAQEAISWGTLAPLVLGSTAKMKGMLFIAKPIAERVKGYLLTRPASREVYHNIIKKASSGSFNNLKGEFSKLEEQVIDEYGSVEAFIKQIIDDLEVYEGEF